MLEAAHLNRFRIKPQGHFVAGDHWLYFCSSSGRLWGTVYWGELEADDLRRLDAAVDVSIDPRFPPHVTLVDARRVTSVPDAAFAKLKTHVTARSRGLARSVTRLALVRPPGVAGAVAEGFFRVLDAPYPVNTFADVGEAIAWLKVPEEIALMGELDALQAKLIGVDPFLRDLRALMESSAASLTLAGAASSLGLSARTLQRRMREHKVGFQDELTRARIEIAKKRLHEPTATFAQVAFDLGFASSQQFSKWFRKWMGQTPSEWRAGQPSITRK